jgi:hypothetical protein
MLNLYGPYEDRKDYTNDLCKQDFLKNANAIIRGGLNFTTRTIKVWVTIARVDPLVMLSLSSWFKLGETSNLEMMIF